MKNCDIKISGLTPAKKIPDFLYCLPNNEISQTYKLSLSENRPRMKNIISLHIKINIKSYKKFFTSSSCRVIINAVRHIEFIYNSIDNHIHTAKYDIPFSMPITLNNSNFHVKNILNSVVKLSIDKITSKSFYLTSTVFAVALIKDTASRKSNKKVNTLSKPNYGYFWNPKLLLLIIVFYLVLSKNNCYYRSNYFLQ